MRAPSPSPAPAPAVSRLLLERVGVPHGFDPAGPGPRVLWRPEQVHGAAVVTVRAPGEPRLPADAAVSADPGRPAAVVTADCIPILLAGRKGRAVAAAHAGWRGVAAGVVEAVVRALAVAGHAPQELTVAVGPGAGGCCYEVGPEVLAALAPPSNRIAPTARGHARLDLRGLVADRLIAAGVPIDAIDPTFPCTICSTDWPSFRRDGTHAGRLCAFIAPVARR